jgi:hypothetical protein
MSRSRMQIRSTSATEQPDPCRKPCWTTARRMARDEPRPGRGYLAHTGFQVVYARDGATACADSASHLAGVSAILRT